MAPWVGTREYQRLSWGFLGLYRPLSPRAREAVPRPRQISDEDLQHVVEARGQGVPWKVLVAELGFSRTRLWQLLKAHHEQSANTGEGKHHGRNR